MSKSAMLAFLMAIGVWSVGGAAHAHDVNVTLRGAERRPGHILATLQTRMQFMQGRGDYSARLDPPAHAGAMTFTFHDVAPGEYVLSVMHDQDDDHQMKKSATGVPQEGWAFSNGGSLAGPPSFDALKFAVGASDVNITTEMFYPYVPAPGQ